MVSGKHDIIYKVEIHNTLQHQRRRTKPQAVCNENLVQFGHIVLEICSHTDCTDRHAYHNITHGHHVGEGK